SARSRPPPVATLFPYTTLFRSLPRPPLLSARAGRSAPGARGAALSHAFARAPDRGPRAFLGGVFPRNGRRSDGRAPAGRLSHDEDRKSTRLNSSHVKISYAVFC